MSIRSAIFLLLVIATVYGAAVPAFASGCERPLTVAMFDWRREANEPIPVKHAYEYDQALWTRVFETLGCRISWIFLPANRLLTGIERGTIDGAIPASIAPGRGNFAYFTASYRKVEIVGFVRKDRLHDIRIGSGSELRNSTLRIGMALGGWYGPELSQLIADAPALDGRILTSDSGPIILGWVTTGRVDMSIMTRSIGEFFRAQDAAYSDLAVYPTVFDTHGFHLMLSKETNTRGRADAIDAALEAFLASEASKVLRTQLGGTP